MDHYRVFGGKSRFVPNAAVDFLCGEDSAEIAHKQVDDLGFGGGQLDRLAVRSENMLFGVVAQAPVYNHMIALLRMDVPQAGITPQLGAHARDQFHGVERLRHIIVRAHGQPQNFIGIFTFGREHDDGQVALFTNLHDGGQSIHFGHHHVDDNQTDRLAHHHVQRFQAVVCT